MKRIRMPSAQRTKPETMPIARPYSGREYGNGQADRERDPRAEQHARIDVAAEHVGAEPVVRRRRARALGGRERGRIDRSEIRCEDRDQDQHQQQRATNGDRRMTAQKADEAATDLDRPKDLRQLRREDEAGRKRLRIDGGVGQ